MNNHRMLFNVFFSLLFVAVVYKTSYAEPANLGLLMQEVEAYHDSGSYQKELTNVIAKAQRYVIRRTEANMHKAHPEKLAIVLDIDETSLSNYKKMAARHFIADHEQLRQDVLAANAPAIEPMLSFYNDALQHGVTIFFVTGRRESMRKATIKNLKSAGYHNWSGLYLRPNHYKEASIIPFKSHAREEITQQGYTIIADIGDQYSDLKGGFTEKPFKLPNPYYYLP